MLSWTQGAWQSPTVVLSGPRFGVHFAGVLLFSILLGLTWMLHIEANGPGGPVSRLLAVDESNLAATTGGDGDRVEVGVTGTAPVPAPAVPEAPGVVVVEPPPAPPALAVPGPVTGDVPSTGSGTYVAGGGGGGGASTVIEERTTVERGPPIAPGPGAVPGGRDVGVPTLANPDSNPTLGSGP